MAKLRNKGSEVSLFKSDSDHPDAFVVATDQVIEVPGTAVDSGDHFVLNSQAWPKSRWELFTEKKAVTPKPDASAPVAVDTSKEA